MKKIQNINREDKAVQRKNEKNDARRNGRTLTKKQIQEKQHKQWVIIVTIATFFSTMLITYISDTLLSHTTLFVSFLILIFIIVFGVLSDVVGVAITAVSPQPFNAMAAKKVAGAKTAVALIRNAPRFSNICNDVLGDICGIVSGATGVSIVAQLSSYYPMWNTVILSLVMSGCIAAFTVGGKAIGKEVAMKKSVSIIFFVSRILSSFKRIFGKAE